MTGLVAGGGGWTVPPGGTRKTPVCAAIKSHACDLLRSLPSLRPILRGSGWEARAGGSARAKGEAPSLTGWNQTCRIVIHNSRSRLFSQGAVGRIRDAWAVLVSAQTPFIRRDEVPTLVAQMAEVETAVSSTLEKLNALAARQRKREYRALQNAPGSSDGPHTGAESPQPAYGGPGASKAALRSQFGSQVLARFRGANQS